MCESNAYDEKERKKESKQASKQARKKERKKERKKGRKEGRKKEWTHQLDDYGNCNVFMVEQVSGFPVNF